MWNCCAQGHKAHLFPKSCACCASPTTTFKDDLFLSLALFSSSIYLEWERRSKKSAVFFQVPFFFPVLIYKKNKGLGFMDFTKKKDAFLKAFFFPTWCREKKIQKISFVFDTHIILCSERERDFRETTKPPPPERRRRRRRVVVALFLWWWWWPQ